MNWNPSQNLNNQPPNTVCKCTSGNLYTTNNFLPSNLIEICTSACSPAKTVSAYSNLNCSSVDPTKWSLTPFAQGTMVKCTNGNLFTSDTLTSETGAFCGCLAFGLSDYLGSFTTYNQNQNCTPQNTLVDVGCITSIYSEPTCFADQLNVNGQCINKENQCPVGYEFGPTGCSFVGCPAGYLKENDLCVFKKCPNGLQLVDGVCIQVPVESDNIVAKQSNSSLMIIVGIIIAVIILLSIGFIIYFALRKSPKEKTAENKTTEVK